MKKKNKTMLTTLAASLAFCGLLTTSCQDDITINVPYEERPAPPPQPKSYNHPGILHTAESFERLRTIVAEQTMPQYSAYQAMLADPIASSSYTMQGPFEIIARQDQYASTKAPSEDDMKAAYYNAIMYNVTGDVAHARKSIEILNAYAITLREIEPAHNDAPLMATLQGFIFANAAELMKHTYPDVSADDVEKWDNMFLNVFMPVLNTFANRAAYTNGNWGTAYVKVMMALGVYLDDTELYEKGVDWYYNANDNGTIHNYISETGQCQESGRDQNHTMLGLGHMAEACEVAFNQGDMGEMYGALDNRLMAGYEYTAKYNLGHDDVPFVTWQDVTGRYSNWTSISTESRGTFNPVFEIAYNHFATRKGASMPYTEQVVSSRTETKVWAADHPGYGTFLFRTNSVPDEEIPGYLAYNFEFASDLMGWEVERGGTGMLTQGVFLVTPAFQSGIRYRGDFARKQTYILHAGNFPVMAMRMEIPEMTSWVLTFDTDGSHGFFKHPSLGNANGQNNHTTIDLDDGSKIYYWDMSVGEFAVSGPLPLSAPESLNELRFKIADLENGGDAVGDFKVHWIRTFRSVAQLEAYADEL